MEHERGRPGLKALRKAKNLTQAQLAYALGTTEKTVRNWENDNAVPSFDKAVLLAKVLSVPLVQLAREFGFDIQGIPAELKSDATAGDSCIANNN